MKLYHFARLIDKYLVPCQLVTKQPGHYNEDTGIWVEPTDETEEIELVLIPVEEKTRYESGGRYTSRDRTIISTVPLPLQALVLHGGQTYQIEEETDYSLYADFNAYIGKWVEPVADTI